MSETSKLVSYNIPQNTRKVSCFRSKYLHIYFINFHLFKTTKEKTQFLLPLHTQTHLRSNANLVFRYRPFGCRKNCFILTNKSNRAMCLRDKLSFVAVKRVLFDFARTLGFIGRYRTEVDDNNSLEWMRLNNPELKFRYWWTHSEHHYMVNTALVSGK